MQDDLVAVRIVDFEVPAATVVLRAGNYGNFSLEQLLVRLVNIRHRQSDPALATASHRQGSTFKRQSDIPAIELGPLILQALNPARQACDITIKRHRSG